MATNVRTSMRITGSAFSSKPAASPQLDTIYYLKTETPHLHDFSVFGPFHCLEAIVPSIKAKLQQESPTGLAMFEDVMSTGPNALPSFEHIVAPLLGNHTMTIRLVKEQNAEVAATLPGPSWVVFCAELLSSKPEPQDRNGGVKMKDMSICGAFVSAQKANQALQQVVADKLQGKSGGRKLELPKEDGTLACMAQLGSKAWLVESRFESGAEIFEG
jgi:hypothetical protein